MVSAVVGAIIAGIILSIFSMQGAVFNEGTANVKLLLQAHAVTEEIGRRVHAGNLVLLPNESWSASFPTAAAVAAADTIRIFNAAGGLSRAYRIGSRSLFESSDGTTWTAFNTGGATVSVASGGGFALPEDRKGVTLNIVLTTVYKGRTYLYRLQGNSWRCRN